MRTVRLYGELAEKYGREFHLHVKTVEQAVKLLAANFKDMKQHLVDSDTRLAGYEVWDGDYNIKGERDEFVKEGSGDIKIIPVLRGASSTARIILGAVLIVVGVLAPMTSSVLIPLGIGLIAGGIAQKMAHTNTNDSEEVADATSYLFGGAVNNTRQGLPIPIGYGQMIVGSNVISASITASDIPI